MTTITLELDGASVGMEDIRRDSSGSSIVFQFSVNFHAETAASIPSRECTLSLTDVSRLVAYARAHVGENIPHTIVESTAFVTYDLGFQLQALAGDLESWTDGYFTMRWMFYCGPNDRAHAAFYVGIEARVEVADAFRWCAALDDLTRAP